MSLVSVCNHTFDTALMPQGPVGPMVLDVGSRNYDFSRHLLEYRGCVVIALDPDKSIREEDRPKWCFFRRVALVGNGKTKSNYASYSTGEGNLLIEGDKYYDAEVYEVPCVDIQTIMKDFRVLHWDLVKLDCEGSEFEILENWPGPIATQISVEFHDGADPTNRTDEYFEKLFKKLPDYKIVQHEKFKQGAWYGHWDTLLTLK